MPENRIRWRNSKNQIKTREAPQALDINFAKTVKVKENDYNKITGDPIIEGGNGHHTFYKNYSI